MARFRRLTLGRLPRVMVRTMALGKNDREVIRLRIQREAGLSDAPWAERLTSGDTWRGDGDDSLAPDFAAVLDLPQSEREPFVRVFDKILDGLLAEDFFGTEGQSDPRGDHR